MTINLKTGVSFDLESNNQDPMYSTQVVDPAIMAQVQGNPKGLRLLLDSKKRLWAPAAMLTSPQNPLNSYAEIATVEPFLLAGASPQPGLVVHSYPTVFRGIGNMGVVASGSYLDSAMGSPYAQASQELASFYRNLAYQELTRAGAFGIGVTSAINGSQSAGWIDIRDLHSILSIYMTCSAGTATLTVEVSTDAGGSTSIVDNVAAAGTITKNYTPTTLATTIAVSPLSFEWIRITAGAAGAGNTTYLLIGCK
jgi:hypothetical protein